MYEGGEESISNHNNILPRNINVANIQAQVTCSVDDEFKY